MKIQFTKMQGLGNDFMVINNLDQSIKLNAQQIQALSDRHFGVGFDQLLMLEPATDPNCDFYYHIYNADGGEVEQCGNGARCVAKFVRDKNIIQKNNILAQTKTRNIKLSFTENNLVKVDMGSYEIKESNGEFGIISMGNPHYVLNCEEIDIIDINAHAKTVEKNFPEGINVGFMEIKSPKKIKLRVFERGAGETLACGSGACAAVVYGQRNHGLAEKVNVNLQGGELLIENLNNQIFMTGPAKTVFEGTINL